MYFHRIAIHFYLICSFIFLSLNCILAQTFTGLGGLMPDVGKKEFTINVTGVNPNLLSSSKGLTSVCLNINHDADSQLEIWLQNPSGKSILLVRSCNDWSQSGSKCCFDQKSTSYIIDNPNSPNHTYKPYRYLGDINDSTKANGTWKLIIEDKYMEHIGVLISWSMTIGANAPSKTADFNKSNIPILKIETQHQNIEDEPKIIAKLQVIDKPIKPNHVNDIPSFKSNINIEIRGSSSQWFHKKSYAFETIDSLGNDLDTSILGLPSEKDWSLIANYNDKSLLNNALAYRLYNTMGNYAPRTKFVDLYINDEYVGVYLLTEKIKQNKNRVDISSLKPEDTTGSEITGGYILKVDKPTGSQYDGWTSSFFPQNNIFGQTIFLQYHYPKPNIINDPQKKYIQDYVFKAENALSNGVLGLPNSEWREYFNAKSFIRYFILNEVSRNLDGYRLSTFLYKPKDNPTAKLHIGPPWDYDLSFGNGDYCNGNFTSGWSYMFNTVCAGDNWLVPFWWSRLLEDELFINELRCEYNQLRKNTLSNESLLSWIDSTSTAMRGSVDHNFYTWQTLGSYVWPNPAPIPSNYDGEIRELKNWIQNRLQWLDNNMYGNCTSTDLLEQSHALTLFISNDIVTITSNKTQTIDWKIFNAQGQVIVGGKQNLLIGKQNLTLQHPLNAGYYYLQIKSGNKYQSLVFTKF